MELNYNSKLSKLYRWFYQTDTMPSNLCPYFWKLGFMWVILIPTLIYTFLYELLFNQYKIEKGCKKGERFELSTVINLLVFIIFCIGVGISSFFVEYSKISPMNLFSMLGCGFMMVLGICGLTIFLIFIGKTLFSYKNKNRKSPNNIKSPNIIKEFVKAKYNKYCPKINWK